MCISPVSPHLPVFVCLWNVVLAPGFAECSLTHETPRRHLVLLSGRLLTRFRKRRTVLATSEQQIYIWNSVSKRVPRHCRPIKCSGAPPFQWSIASNSSKRSSLDLRASSLCTLTLRYAKRPPLPFLCENSERPSSDPVLKDDPGTSLSRFILV